MPALDADMAFRVAEELGKHGVDVRPGVGVTAIHASDRVTGVQLDHDEVLPADVVILAVGVRPETTLARQIGVELGTTGAIRVDQTMRTNLPGISRSGRRRKLLPDHRQAAVASTWVNRQQDGTHRR